MANGLWRIEDGDTRDDSFSVSVWERLTEMCLYVPYLPIFLIIIVLYNNDII